MQVLSLFDYFFKISSYSELFMAGLQIHPLGTSESGVEADIDVDSSENLSAGSIGKVSTCLFTIV